MNSERAQAFLRELDDSDLQNDMKANSSIPGFITNFFQGNELQIKVKKMFLLLLFLIKLYSIKMI